jgi:hypothetical protein
MTLTEAAEYWTVFSAFLVPTLVVVSRPLSTLGRAADEAAKASPAKWDDRPARALRWLLVGFEANADRLSRFVAALLPMAAAAREAMNKAPKSTEGDES